MSRILSNLKLFKIFKYNNNNTKNNEERERIYENIVEEEYGYYICRELIEKKYIKDVFNHSKIKGLILLNKQTDCIIGFMLFTIHKTYIKLKLLGTIEDKEERMGIKIGSLFLEILENYSINRNIFLIKSNVVKEAIDFYKKCDYEIIKEKDELYSIEKDLIKRDDYIKNLFDFKTKNDKYYYDLDEDDFDSDEELCYFKNDYSKDSSEDINSYKKQIINYSQNYECIIL